MKLLIVTQVIDTEHPILWFFHRWVEEFAKHCEHVHVICLQAGQHSLPPNVTIHSLGKESGKGKLVYLLRFYKLIWQLRHEYDNVFIHMNQIYVILGAPVWKLLRKKVGLWYVHRQVSLSLKCATLLVDKIFTSSPESFRIKTNKVKYVGHGIDFSTFDNERQIDNSKFVISHFGRISRIKNIDVLLKAVSNSNNKEQIEIHLYGEAQTGEDQRYKKELKELVASERLAVHFVGSIKSSEVPQKLQKTNLSVNLTPEGGWDKVVIEAIASHTTVLTSNTAFSGLLNNYKDTLIFQFADVDDLATKIDNQFSLNETDIKKQTSYVYDQSKEFDLKNLIPKLITK